MSKSKPSTGLLRRFESELDKIKLSPVIHYEVESLSIEEFLWVIRVDLNDRELALFYNYSKACLAILITGEWHKVILNEQTKPTHKKDSRQGLQGPGFFRLLGHYASHLRQLLRKRKAAR